MPKLTKTITRVEEATYSLELSGEEVTALVKVLGESDDTREKELGLEYGVVYGVYDVLTDPPSLVNNDGEAVG